MKNPIDIFLGWLARKLEEKKREVTCKVELRKETIQEPVQKLTKKATEEKLLSGTTRSFGNTARHAAGTNETS